MTFSPEQLNFFKFSSVVLDEFPVTLRSVFVFMWDNFVAATTTTPGVPKWDGSITVHNIFLTKEGGPKKAPTLNKSYKEWDCTTLFKATLFAQTFAMPDGTGGVSTLDRLYVKPLRLSAGIFHTSVRSATGNHAETCALALDQLRLLRNTLCHQISTREIDKATFAHYLSLAKDAFTALGQNTSRIDEIGKLAEDDFPTARRKQLEEDLKREKDTATTFKQIDDHLINIESKVRGVVSDVKNLKTGVTDVKTQVEEVGSNVRNVKTEVSKVTTQMKYVGSDVKGVKTGVTEVKTQVKEARSYMKDVKTGVTQVKAEVKDVRSGVRYVKTGVTEVKTQIKNAGLRVKNVTTEVTDVKSKVKDVGSNVRDVKTGVTEVKTQLKDVGSDLKDVKTGVTDVKTQVKDVGTDVKDVKTGVTEVKTQVKDIGSNVKDVKTGVTEVKSQVKDVGSDVKDVKTGVTEVKTQVKDVGSDVKDVKTGVAHVKAEVEGVGSDVRYVKTGVKEVKTQVKDIESNVKGVKTGVAHVKAEVEGVGSDVKDVKTGVTEVKTQVKDIESNVKDVKTGVAHVKAEVEGVGSDVSYAKTGVKEVKTQVKDVGSDVKDVKTGVTDVKTQVEDIRSDVRELKADFAHKQQAMQWEGSKGPLIPHSCIPDKIPHFVGRQKECQVILEHLTNCGTRLVDIWGPPGFGKTSLATNVAHQLREMEIPTFFTSLRGMTSKDELVAKLLSIFADARQAVYVSPSHWLMQCLQQLRNPFVLVLDNADDLLESGNAKLKEDVLRFAEEILTQCSHIKLLFTTREPLDYLSQKIPIHSERVGVLDVASSLTLVWSLSPNLSDDNCSSIVRVCGQVPLAVRLMCSIMAQEHVPLNEVLEELKILPIVEILDNESFPDDARLKTIINKSFERLSNQEKDVFVSLVVFPGSFGIGEATAVADLKTLRENKKVIRSLERKSLVDCSKDLSTFTVHSLLRSFVDDRRKTNQETGDTFRAAQRRFYGHHISRFEMANEKFLTGQSNEALAMFLNHRDSMILSLISGIRDEELYAKAVEVLSKAELFLFAILPFEESLFKTIYGTALKEAKRRHEVRDEGKLLAARSFSHWGWFSSDHQTCDDSFPVGLTSSAGCCPAKLLCYFGIYQLLGGKVDEGISSLQQAANSLSSSCDETILKQLVYDVLAISCRKKEEHKMASYISGLYNIMAKTSSVRTCLPKDMLSYLRDNGFCFQVIAALLRLLLSEKKSPDHGYLYVTGAVYKYIYSLNRESFLDWSSLEHIHTFLENKALTGRLNANELAKEWLIPNNLAIAFESSFHGINNLLDMQPSSTTLFDFNQHFEKTLLPFVENVSETCPEVFLIFGLQPVIAILIEILKSPKKFFGDGLHVDVEDWARTSDILGKCLYCVKDYSRAIVAHQNAIKAREDNVGNHVDTLSSLTNTGCVHFAMSNEIEGVKSFQRAFELRKQLGIYDPVDTANIYFTLGNKHRTLANYEKAIDAHLKALQLRKKHLGEHSLTGQNLQTIAEVYYEKGIHSVNSHCNSLEKFPHLMGGAKALTFCKQALAMRLKLKQYLDTAKSFHLLGCIHVQMGDIRSAVEAYKNASYMRSTHLGDHPDTAHSYHYLGLGQMDMGDFNGALQSLQKALELKRKLSIAVCDNIADVTDSIGLVYFNVGNYQSAKEHFRDAVDLHEKLLGKHKSTAQSYNNLALTYVVTKSYSKALECYKQASTMRLEILGEHVHTADSFHALGGVYYRMGDFTSALEAFQIASGMRSNLLGDHLDKAQSYYYVGVAQFYTGAFEGALESLRKTLRLGKRLNLYPGVADIINYLGRVHLKMGNYQSARKQFQKAVILNKKFRGKHVKTAKSCHNLALTYLHLGSYTQALDVCQQALSMRPKLLGNNEETLNSLETLECIHLKMGNICSAYEAFCKASDIKCNRPGDNEVTGSHWKDWKWSIS